MATNYLKTTMLEKYRQMANTVSVIPSDEVVALLWERTPGGGTLSSIRSQLRYKGYEFERLGKNAGFKVTKRPNLQRDVTAPPPLVVNTPPTEPTHNTFDHVVCPVCGGCIFMPTEKPDTDLPVYTVCPSCDTLVNTNPKSGYIVCPNCDTPVDISLAEISHVRIEDILFAARTLAGQIAFEIRQETAKQNSLLNELTSMVAKLVQITRETWS